MLTGNNFTDNFTADFPVGIFQNNILWALWNFDLYHILYLCSLVNNKYLNKWCRHTFISICVNFLKNKLKNINKISKKGLTEIAKTQIYLICKIGRNNKCKYQKNCAFSFKRKRTAWNKSKDKTVVLETQANLAESDKGSFCNQR